jgi:hypothetical protein
MYLAQKKINYVPKLINYLLKQKETEQYFWVKTEQFFNKKETDYI